MIVIAALISMSCLLVLLLIYIVQLRFRKLKQYQHTIKLTAGELQQAHDHEQELQEQLRTLENKFRYALKDAVTHLLGWPLFEDRLYYNIQESLRYRLTLGVLFVDIDDFRMVNNALGHEIGDTLLGEVANRLSSSIRKVDSVSRFTKDTFAILLTQLSKPETATVVAQRILQAFDPSFQIADQELYLTASIGIAIYPLDGQDGATLLRNANQALQSAKKKGKHRVQFYQESLTLNSYRELALYTGLRRDTLLHEVIPYYQPIIDVTTQKIFCLDAFLYWQHPELGLIPPSDLFNYAEKQQKLNTLCEWLLQHACQQFLRWRAEGLDLPLLGISLSLKQLENTHFIYRISQILQEQQFNPEWLLLEIKEGSLPLSFDVLEKVFNMLKYLKIKLSMDDFGMNVLSLAHLKTFPVQYIKLDHSFTLDMDHNERAFPFIKAMAYAAKSMSMELIVRDVQSESQVVQLQKLGCSLMQGPYLSDPLLEKEIVEKALANARLH